VGGGTLYRAETIEILAATAGLPSGNLAATIAEYNDAVRFNRLSTLSPERSILSGGPRRIETPPFFAIPICAGITNAMGGIPIDGARQGEAAGQFGDRRPLCRRRHHRRP
jgi:fumarate reductase flavoprotein subunit